MNDLILNTNTLPEQLLRLIDTDKVRVRKEGRLVTIMPVEETFDCVAGLRGMLAGNEAISVDKFLERKHSDKGLDL